MNISLADDYEIGVFAYTSVNTKKLIQWKSMSLKSLFLSETQEILLELDTNRRLTVPPAGGIGSP